MNLAFNFQDKLFWIHNFLPEYLYKEMYLDFFNNRKNLNFQKSGVSWRTYKEELDNMSTSFNQKNNIPLDYFNKYHTFVRHQRFVNLLNCKFESHLRRFKYNQHLAWHDDKGDKRIYAATYYFNHRWGESWGGEFMFKDKSGSGFIPILGNSIVLVKVGLTHKVNANLKKTHDRMSIQTWVNNVNVADQEE